LFSAFEPTTMTGGQAAGGDQMAIDIRLATETEGLVVRILSVGRAVLARAISFWVARRRGMPEPTLQLEEEDIGA
jgi:hypothetical protein